MPPSSSLRIGEYTESHLLKCAKDICEKKTRGWHVFDTDAEARIPVFESSELTIGRVLGRGGFCVVSEIKKVTLHDGAASKQKKKTKDDDEHFVNVVQDRNFMETYCIRNGKDSRYAIKRLHENVLKDHQLFVNGIVDLAIEAKFLSVFRHPNIIKMRATAVGPRCSRDFFVILDRLYDILSIRLGTWKKRKPGGLNKLMDPKGKKATAFWLERIAVAHDLACALKYMHSLNLIYRDLKPDNIGFDVRGDLKIFDFGLCREFDPSKATKDGTYKLTGDTGSTRYMAPEVALDKPYNETADVYSFGILFYQIMSMEVPFSCLTVKNFPNMVFTKGARPVPDPKWPATVSDLMRKCWSANIKERPSMEDVASILLEEINANSDEEIFDIMDVSRKSELSLRGH